MLRCLFRLNWWKACTGSTRGGKVRPPLTCPIPAGTSSAKSANAWSQASRPSLPCPAPWDRQNHQQLRIICDLLDEGVPPHHMIRIQFDQNTVTEDMLDPILRITSWIEHGITPATFNALAHQGQTACLFFGEVQHISNRHNQLKFLVDHSAVRVVATGSSALRIERGGHAPWRVVPR